MKVLHVIPSVSAIHGGPSTVLRTLTTALATKGIEVDVITTNDDGMGRLADVPLEVPQMIAGVKYLFFQRSLRFYKVSWSLARWLEVHCRDYDLLHIHALFSFSSTVAARSALRHDVPYLLRPLGTLNRWGRVNRRPWLKKLSLELVDRRLITGAAAVHFTSEQEQREALEAVPIRQCFVLPNPVDLDPGGALLPGGWLRARYPSIGPRKVILFLSRFDVKKGLELLLDAFAMLCRLLPDASVLVLSGDGEQGFIKVLREKVAELGISGSVVWTGFLRGSEKDAALRDSDVFVLPSYSENFGVSVVEAMGRGLPVIVSDQVALHHEIAQAEAGLVVKCSPHAIQQALMELLTRSDLRESVRRNGLALASQFEPSVVAGKLLTIYQQLGVAKSLCERVACSN